MALKIRLQRGGKPHAPKYTVVVAESTCRRDGRCVEQLGYYNPKARGRDLEVSLNVERIQYWVGVGAKMTEVVRGLVGKNKVCNA